MSKKYNFIIIGFFIAIIIFLGLLVIGFFDSKPRLKPIKMLKEFSLQTIYPKHEILSSQDLKGQYYMVNFMASWCGHCIDEIVEINAIRDKIPVKYIAIIVSDSEANIADLFTNIKNPFDYLAHNNRQVADNFGNYSLPQNFIVNEKGEIVFKHNGVISREQFEEQIIPFLNEHMIK